MPVIKVQVPLVSNRKGPVSVLVYAEGRKHMTEQPLDKYLLEKLNGDVKAYFNGYYSSIVGWAINERVEDQNW